MIDLNNLRIVIDGDDLLQWFRKKESVSVIDTETTYLITAPIGDILDGAIENMKAEFGDD